MEKEENIVRKILMSEITWLLLIVGSIAGFYSQVIIPINTIQIQLAQIRSDITEIKGYDARITANSNAIIVLQQEINQKQ